MNLTTGVVLAGGASRRMGQDKAALVLDGETLLARVVRLLAEALGAVMVVGQPERAAQVPNTRIVPDERPGAGPLGGIYSALLAAETPRIFVVACDMPFISQPFVRYLVSLAPECDIVVPQSARGLEPLHAVYSKACLTAVEDRLQAGELAVAALIAASRTRVVAPGEWAPFDPEGRSLINVNTPEEWQRIARTLADPD